MLSYLKISNFALIDELEIEFEEGLNVITGETGAGKSMIIESINAILGGSVQNNLIKSNADFLEVEALFRIQSIQQKKLEEIEEVSDILSHQNQIVIRRQLHRKKKNKCWINNHLVTLSLLQFIGNILIDLHGQHSHQSLLQAEKHIDLIDNLCDHAFFRKQALMKNYFSEWQLKTKLIRQLLQKRRENLSKKDYFLYQLKEIEDARLRIGEDKELEEKINIACHTVKIKEIMETANISLYEGGAEGEPSTRDTLNKLISQFQGISHLDQKIRFFTDQLKEIQFKIEDIADQIIDYKDNVDFDEKQLQGWEDRLNLINHLKQKYGLNLEEILHHQHLLKQQLSSIEDDQMKIEKLKNEIEEDEKKLVQLSLELSQQRNSISKKLEKEIIEELNELQMTNCRFVIKMEQREDDDGVKIGDRRLKMTPKGVDFVEFFISPNPGENLKPLAEIVSGGEISRIMLGLKSVLSKVDYIPTMIFDEIDSGVGARLGEIIAQKLLKISQYHQVITVTHLPQIASRAKQHLFISKYVHHNKTGILVKKLYGNAQVEEIAHMLDGEKYGSISIEHARKMLDREEILKDEKRIQNKE